MIAIATAAMQGPLMPVDPVPLLWFALSATDKVTQSKTVTRRSAPNALHEVDKLHPPPTWPTPQPATSQSPWSTTTRSWQLLPPLLLIRFNFLLLQKINSLFEFKLQL